ncbi:MAG: DUF4252 domain-containing protein [Saprospiraceae bacterium]|nr:DUF4252 domain-containing protein [Saprospiraceae bacterium]MBK8669875.1 DUF4252 domain-containing protein [Saprospiraceae bacterium]
MKSLKVVSLYACLLMFSMSVTPMSGQSSVKKIMSQLKKTEKYEGISIPGWILRLGYKIVAKGDIDLKESGLLSLAGSIKHLRVATTTLDVNKYNTRAIVNNFIKSVKEKDGFEEYLSVRSEDQHLKIMMQEHDNLVKNIVILSDDNGEIAIIHAKTHLHLDDLKNISFSQWKNQSEAVKQSK